jgi:hypothetical protein
MRFNAKKCYILSINKESSKFYQLNNHILQEVQDNPYLGLQISNDLKWTIQINNTCKKANATLFVKFAKPIRQIKIRNFKDFDSQNILEKRACNNTRTLIIPTGRSKQYNNSFFMKTAIVTGITSQTQ